MVHVMHVLFLFFVVFKNLKPSFSDDIGLELAIDPPPGGILYTMIF